MQEKLKVLIIDDSEAVREALKDILSEITIVELIGEAMDGEFGIDLVTKLEPHVIILDLNMPKINGLDVLSFVKKNYPSIIVIVMTNYPTEYFKLKCEKLGADYFFDKSNEFELIYKTLDDVGKKLKIFQEIK
jgi:DNA-binding NarL/FixJ family response regulator